MNLAFPSPTSWDEIDMISQFLKYINKTVTKIPNVKPYSATKVSKYVGRNPMWGLSCLLEKIN